MGRISKKLKERESIDSEMRTSCGSRFTPCPVCGKNVAIALVHEHLNLCLEGSTEVKSVAARLAGTSQLGVGSPEAANGKMVHRAMDSATVVEKTSRLKRQRVATADDGSNVDSAQVLTLQGAPLEGIKAQKYHAGSGLEGEFSVVNGGPSSLRKSGESPDAREKESLSGHVSLRQRCDPSGREPEKPFEVDNLEQVATVQGRQYWSQEAQAQELQAQPDSKEGESNSSLQGHNSEPARSSDQVKTSEVESVQAKPTSHASAEDKNRFSAQTTSSGGDNGRGTSLVSKDEWQISKEVLNSIAPIFKKPNKVIYLIRHGNTTMNSGAAFRPFDIQEEIRNKDAEVAISTVAARTDSSGRIFDVPLSPLGLKQAAGLKPKLPGMKAEVILVSPLTRALQTCQEALGNLKVPIEVTSRHAEHVACCGDVGRPPNVLAPEFPTFDLSQLQPVWWYSPPGAPNHALSGTFLSRESMGHLRERVQRFRSYLQQRPERTIVVIGHSTFFRELLGSKRRMSHCEVVQLRL